MIDYAHKYREELKEVWPDLINSDYYQWYVESQVKQYVPEIEVYTSNSQKLQMVSLNYDKDLQNWMLLGFIEAELDWVNRTVTNFSYADFVRQSSPTFTRDIVRVINRLFYDMNFRKINLNTIEGNPNNNFTKKFVEKFGGNFVGTLTNEIELKSEYQDMQLYEILKDNWTGRGFNE